MMPEVVALPAENFHIIRFVILKPPLYNMVAGQTPPIYATAILTPAFGSVYYQPVYQFTPRFISFSLPSTNRSQPVFFIRVTLLA